MLGILILLTSMGVLLCDAKSGSPKTQNSPNKGRNPQKRDTKAKPLTSSYPYPQNKSSRTFTSFSSGYDSARQIHWQRKSKWEIKEL